MRVKKIAANLRGACASVFVQLAHALFCRIGSYLLIQLNKMARKCSAMTAGVGRQRKSANVGRSVSQWQEDSDEVEANRMSLQRALGARRQAARMKAVS